FHFISMSIEGLVGSVSVLLSFVSFVVASILYACVHSVHFSTQVSEAHVRRSGDVIVESRLHPLTTEKIAQKSNYSNLANSLQVELHAVDTPNPLIPYTKVSAINKVIVAPKEKKEKDAKPNTPSAEGLPPAKTAEKTAVDGEPQKKDVFAKPENQRQKVAVNDPQYHTLANLDNTDAFGTDKKTKTSDKSKPEPNKDKPILAKKAEPEEEQKYQTLAAVEANDKKDLEEKAAAAAEKGKGAFAAPQVVKKAESNDPQYQTLVNLDNADAFGPQKPVFKTPTKVSKAEAKDPQYQTLAGLDDNLFKEEEKPGEAKKEEKKEPSEKKKKEE
ncbi:hypothetical protein PFISCL1PPCAC_24481, partial [Pristionchus fissidentatus]